MGARDWLRDLFPDWSPVPTTNSLLAPQLAYLIPNRRVRAPKTTCIPVLGWVLVGFLSGSWVFSRAKRTKTPKNQTRILKLWTNLKKNLLIYQ